MLHPYLSPQITLKAKPGWQREGTLIVASGQRAHLILYVEASTV